MTFRCELLQGGRSITQGVADCVLQAQTASVLYAQSTAKGHVRTNTRVRVGSDRANSSAMTLQTNDVFRFISTDPFRHLSFSTTNFSHRERLTDFPDMGWGLEFTPRSRSTDVTMRRGAAAAAARHPIVRRL